MPAQKILIVDDNRDFRATLRQQLEMWGYEVMESDEAQTGIETALQEAPDLLLLDYHMPYVKGIQLASNALTRRPDLPVMFLTGEFEMPVLKAMMPSGIHVVPKPFDAEDLHQNIYRLLH